MRRPQTNRKVVNLSIKVQLSEAGQQLVSVRGQSVDQFRFLTSRSQKPDIVLSVTADLSSAQGLDHVLLRPEARGGKVAVAGELGVVHAEHGGFERHLRTFLTFSVLRLRALFGGFL